MKVDGPVVQWARFELTLFSALHYANPVQDAAVAITWTAPSGRSTTTEAFWDGGQTWRARFSPDEPGGWRWESRADPDDRGLHAQRGAFVCLEPTGAAPAPLPLGLSDDRRFFTQADGTPFLLLADTAWTGPMQASAEEWDHYLSVRAAQGFTAVMFVATPFFVNPQGDREGQFAYQGRARIELNPAFFQRLDARMDAINRAGLVAMPYLLWAARWPRHPELNPGVDLPEDQAALLARYIVNRWGAHRVLWSLNGDGDYVGADAARWNRIGAAVFGDRPHAPVSVHQLGHRWPNPAFEAAAWLDINGYQSGHGDAQEDWRWLGQGTPAQQWMHGPARPSVNLEPPYEGHIARDSGRLFTDADVRHALYTSLLIAPPAGVGYGGHGVWDWNDGTHLPLEHENTGQPLAWRQALHLPGAEQVRHLAAVFGTLPWWTLRPAPQLLAVQPGDHDAQLFIACASSDDGRQALVYVPAGAGQVSLRLAQLAPERRGRWWNPRVGGWHPDAATPTEPAPPDAGDWLLVIGDDLGDGAP